MNGLEHDWAVTAQFFLTVAVLLPICLILAAGFLGRRR